MKILIAPLNWGLGHASRCVPLVRRFTAEGHEVILGGDGDSLTLLRRHFPRLRYVYLAPLDLRYGKGKRQVWAMVKALPRLLAWAVKDHAMLAAVMREEKIDRVVSDNRFGLFNPSAECIYITHQLHIFLPHGWRWLESAAERIHAAIYKHYNAVWVPDYEAKEKSLAGELSHPESIPENQRNKITYIGPLSRFEPNEDVRNANEMYSIAAVLSGLEPQRTMLEKEILSLYRNTEEQVLVVQGLPGRPNTRFKRGNITIVPYLNDDAMVAALQNAKRIITRSGYSSIMDLAALGVMEKAELIPTPGQPEQEYLALLHCKK